jgi:hypothetical protein
MKVSWRGDFRISENRGAAFALRGQMLHTACRPHLTTPREENMKTKLASIVVLTLLAAAPFVYGQDTSGTEKKSTGTDMKDATKTAAKKTGHATKTAAKDTEMGAKTAAKDTEKGTKVAAKDTEKAADKTGAATEKAAKKTGSGVKKGVKSVGHDVKKGTEKTADAVK